MASNMTPPKVRGVEMRARESADGREWFELNGVTIQRTCNGKGWVSEVKVCGVRLGFAQCETPDIAARSAENNIETIRAAVERLGK